MKVIRRATFVALACFAAVPATSSAAGRCGDVAARPWCDTSLSPDTRAELLLKALTAEEKASLLAGDNVSGVAGDLGLGVGDPGGETGHSGRSNGIARVGLPPVYYTDGPAGVRQGKGTGLPSPMPWPPRGTPRSPPSTAPSWARRPRPRATTSCSARRSTSCAHR